MRQIKAVSLSCSIKAPIILSCVPAPLPNNAGKKLGKSGGTTTTMTMAMMMMTENLHTTGQKRAIFTIGNALPLEMSRDLTKPDCFSF